MATVTWSDLHTRTTSIGRRSAPVIWNSLLLQLRSPSIRRTCIEKFHLRSSTGLSSNCLSRSWLD